MLRRQKKHLIAAWRRELAAERMLAVPKTGNNQSMGILLKLREWVTTALTVRTIRTATVVIKLRQQD